jgi:hypothetical protein
MMNTSWTLLGVYLLGSMPLYMMHGTNTYADAYMSVHVMLAASFVFLALREKDRSAMLPLFRIAAVLTGILPFVKNEGLLLYAPPLALITIIGLFVKFRRQEMTMKDIGTILLWFAGFAALCALPWLIFKWENGMTFGNAKPFTTLGIGWQEGVLIAILINNFSEGNWLLMLPLLILLIIWRKKAAFGSFIPLTAFVMIVVVGQWFLYLFTGLAWEARMQTGLARGIVQMMPTITVLTGLLLADASPSLTSALRELAQKTKLAMSKLQ